MPTQEELRKAREVLGVKEGDSEKEIRDAWIKYMKQDQSALGNEAYELLIGKRDKSSCMGIIDKNIEEKVAFAQKYKRQFGQDVWNY